MSDTIREIHTGFYNDRAEQIMRCLLESAQQRLAGMKRTFKVKSMIYLDIKRAIDNEVVFTCNRFNTWRCDGSCFYNISDADALNHIAWCFKTCALRCLENQLPIGDDTAEMWNRSNALKFSIKSLDDITVSEVYFIYDHLCGRKNAAKRYSKEMADSLIGLPLDPIMTTMKLGMLDEIERIKNECENAKMKLYHDKEDAIKKYRESIVAQYNESLAALNKETADKIAKIKAEMAAMATT